MIACANALMAAGATTINAIAIHALFPPKFMSTFTRVGIRSVRSTYSVAHFTNAFNLDEILTAALDKETASWNPAERLS